MSAPKRSLWRRIWPVLIALFLTVQILVAIAIFAYNAGARSRGEAPLFPVDENTERCCSQQPPPD